ncbi:YfgM family protein [Pleionea mediterranea]|uniref:Ancillary SecYEG translocon subunit n=1 Tax=Pleionea mediterranea TaxID=523701 RepID=A0A316G1H7_9GAMM|nr:tetratricopeptide repeat protein [Pleionea mediterranea]PWK54235.1 putative negative regulator of RcsB-dependent stress response [Pleionea mediterranea]
MEVYSTEEEQIKALKDWWSENGTSIIVGVVIGVGGFFGYNWWKSENIAKQQQGSNEYQTFTQIDAANEQESFISAANQIKADYADSGYAILAALHLAKKQVDNNDYAAAEKELNWVVTQTEGHDLQPLMKIRLARVLNAQQKYQQAETLLTSITAESYAGLKQQVLGDTYLLMGDKVKARSAYATAKESTESYIAKNELEMLVNDLASYESEAVKADDAAAPTEESTTQQSTDKQES